MVLRITTRKQCSITRRPWGFSQDTNLRFKLSCLSRSTMCLIQKLIMYPKLQQMFDAHAESVMILGECFRENRDFDFGRQKTTQRMQVRERFNRVVDVLWLLILYSYPRLRSWCRSCSNTVCVLRHRKCILCTGRCPGCSYLPRS